MEWVKLAAIPPYYLDSALLRAGEAAEVLFCRALAYCGSVESAGRVNKLVLPMLVRSKPQERADALVSEGLWLDDGDAYVIRSWATWQDEHDRAAARRKRDRDRQRQYRAERRRRDDGVTVTVTSHVTATDGHTDVTPPEEEREGETSRTTSLSLPRKRGTAVPDVWPPDPETAAKLAAWAAERAPSVDLRRETERWQDWHRANGKTARDWCASWRTWMSRAAERQPATGRPSTSDQRVATGLALVQHFQQAEQRQIGGGS
jgi:hypothetical protein